MSHRTTKISPAFLAITFPILALTGAFSPAIAAPPETSVPAAQSDLNVQAQEYLDEWNAKGQAACEANDPACPKLGELLYNAAGAFQAAGERNKAMAARRVLLTPRYHLENTEIAKRTMFHLAEDFKALTEYAQAAEQLEAAVIRAPGYQQAPDALMDATVLQLALGDLSHASKNAEQFDKLFGAKKPAMAATVWLSIALTHLDRELLPEAKALFIKIVPRVDKVGELRDRFIAHDAFGRTLQKLEDLPGAEKEYGIVRSMWQNADVQNRMMSEYGDNPRALGRVLTAVGEAMFFFAEQKRKDVDKIAYPVYKGDANIDAIKKHIQTKVVDWITKKRPAIEAAEASYRLILDLQPAPPPQWVVASANRVGTMWGTFVAEFRAAPLPKEWKKNGPIPGVKDLTFEEVRNSYYGAIDAASEPQKKLAKSAFKRCVEYSVKFQYVDDYARSCQRWLEKNYHKEFVRVDEILPPLRSQSWNLGFSDILSDSQSK
jgi:tetratricopeptide (TPR) repeat protein